MAGQRGSFNAKRIRAVGQRDLPMMADELADIRSKTLSAVIQSSASNNAEGQLTFFNDPDGRLSFNQTQTKWESACSRLDAAMDKTVKRLERAGRAMVYCAENYEHTEDTASKRINDIFETTVD